MRALLHGGLGQPDEYGLGQSAVGNVDFDLDRHGVDPDERKSPQFRKHPPGCPFYVLIEDECA